jgi:hypothetical protein
MDTYVVTVHRIYAQSLAGRMAYEIDHHHRDEARAFGVYAVSFDPQLDPDRARGWRWMARRSIARPRSSSTAFDASSMLPQGRSRRLPERARA